MFRLTIDIFIFFLGIKMNNGKKRKNENEEYEE